MYFSTVFFNVKKLLKASMVGQVVWVLHCCLKFQKASPSKRRTKVKDVRKLC